jgi:hypothetical protein
LEISILASKRTIESSFCGGASMEEKYIEELYRLLENPEKEKDSEAMTALRWAIFNLENK